MPVNVGVRYRSKEETKSHRASSITNNSTPPISTPISYVDIEDEETENELLVIKQESIVSTAPSPSNSESFANLISNNSINEEPNTPSSSVQPPASIQSSAKNSTNQIEKEEEDWRNKIFFAEQTQKYWRSASEWLYVQLEKLRTSEYCADHEMLGIMYNGFECRFSSRSIPVDGYCTQ